MTQGDEYGSLSGVTVTDVRAECSCGWSEPCDDIPAAQRANERHAQESAGNPVAHRQMVMWAEL